MLVTLGCDKNTVDSETILSFFKRNNFEIINDPSDADAIVINTCGFIEDAKTESLDTIFEYSKYDAKLIVTGCLVERYYKELKEELSDIVDLFIPIRDYKKMSKEIIKLFPDEIKEEYNPYFRLYDDSFSAFLKISDGCNHYCAYCAIPLIRGRFSSIPKEIILKQAEELAKAGKKEIVIVSQDTSCYGSDLYKDYNICSLLKDLLKIKEIKSIRLLYLYAQEIDDELINLIKENSEVLQPYFDIPVQHTENKLLKSMNRKDTKEGILSLIDKIRTEIPSAILRTTIIVGYPGETSRDFSNMIKFLKLCKFDHLGAFKYSPEEGTVGANLPHQVRPSTKQKRYDSLLKEQMPISFNQNKKHKDEIMNGFIISKEDKNTYLVRTYFNAPGEIDGDIIVTSSIDHKIGDEVKIKILTTSVYDLYGEEII